MHKISLSNADAPVRNEIIRFSHLEIFVDSSKSLTIDQIGQQSFSRIKDKKHLGIYSEYDTWIKLNVSDYLLDEKGLVLLIDQANIDSIDLFQKDDAFKWRKTSLGSNYPFSVRSYPTTHFIMDVDGANHEIIYLKIRSQFETTFNLLGGTKESVLLYENNFNYGFILIIGAIFAMVLYNMFLYISIKEPVYLIYVVQSILTGILQVVLYGASLQYFWPNHMWLQEFSMVFFTSVSTLSGLVFMVYFLRTRQNTPVLHKISVGLILLYGILSIVAWISPNIIHGILLTSQPIIAVYIFVVAVIVIYRGYQPAKYYLFAWSMFLLGILFFVLAETGVIERNMLTTLAIPFGTAFEVVLLSLALANRINILKNEQEEAVSKSFRLEKEKASIIQEQNLVLEQKVKNRTEQLNNINAKLGEKNQEVELAYLDLKNAQSQLVTAEKMSSLGQLTAGIAHEINNPINFVSSNVSPLKRDIEDLIELYEKTEAIAKINLPAEKFNEIEEFKNEIEYSYVIEEINDLLMGMKDGANRTVEIIKGLKLFSRVDEDDLKKVNLEEGINATLVLLNSHIKHHLEVETNFSGIANIDCYGGKMNQVFMNILSNAIHAVSENGKEAGKIVITTSQEDSQVFISIKDNGKGMTEDVKNKLFEPFFTTKPVGEGTGLGLSIVFSIIEKINGKIEVNSTLGTGTEFMITLPITNKQKHHKTT